MYSEPADIAQLQQLLDVPHPALRGVILDLGAGHRLRAAQPALDGRFRRRAGRLTRVAALTAGSLRSARAA
jgi:hypothetical protein